MQSFVYLAALPPAVLASPAPVQDVAAREANWGGGNYCQNIDWLINANHAQSYAGVFCSSYLGVKTSTTTKYATATVTGSKCTSTATVSVLSTPTVTSVYTAISTLTATATSYFTSTCTPYNSAAATTSGSLHKRTKWTPNKWCWQWEWPYPSSQYQPSDISSACSCLVTTPTATASCTSTVTQPGAVTTLSVTTTVFPTTSTVLTTVTSVSTSTNTLTYTEIEPANPTGRYQTNDGSTSFEEYSGIDFFSGDLQPYSPCSCDLDGSGGACVIGGVNYGLCTGFDSCQNICAAINHHNHNVTCAAVTYTGTDASGECYPKSSLNGCGVVADQRQSGLINLQGYSP